MKVAFLDRDGVINIDTGYVCRVEDFFYTDRCTDALKIFSAHGFRIIIITNQAGIARGYYSERDFQKLMNWLRMDLREYGIDLLDYFYCPHHPEGSVPEYRKLCGCRKPAPGLIAQAASKYSVDLKESFLVGDKKSDLEAARLAGVGKYFQVGEDIAVNRNVLGSIRPYRNVYELAQSKDWLIG